MRIIVGVDRGGLEPRDGVELLREGSKALKKGRAKTKNDEKI